MGNVVGIIAEYNPFHNGHFYHIQQSKRLTGANFCVCIISGNFTQRGSTSIINKWAKTYMALCQGADLVIELPTVYSVSSAENFARGAIKILDSLKIVTDLAFGAECDDLGALNNITNVLMEEPKSYKTILEQELKRGLSFPAARENAIMMYLNDIKRYANIMSGSNNILAMEYLKALKNQKSRINPVVVKRNKVYYNDKMIVDGMASSTAIRKLIIEKDYLEIGKVVPKSTYKILENELNEGHIVLSLNDYENEIIYALRRMSIEEIANLPDVLEGLENSIKKAVNESNSLREIISRIKSKRYTETRICRILTYALLGINKELMEISKKIIPYTRVLGFNKKGKALLSEIVKQNPKINLITSVAKFVKETPKRGNCKQLMSLLEKDILATDIYTLAYKKGSKANLDYTNNMIIIK